MIWRGLSASLSNGIGSILGTRTHFQPASPDPRYSFANYKAGALVSMEPSSVLLTDRVAVVTGGGAGIGRGIAAGLAAFGASVAIWERDPESCAAAAEEIGALASVTDVRDSAAVDAALARTTEELGTVSILVNNAGGVFSSPILETTENGWDALYRANLRHVLLCTQRVARGMVA